MPRADRKPLSFKETDVARAIRSVRQGGVEVTTVTINPRTGEIVLAVAPPATDTESRAAA